MQPAKHPTSLWQNHNFLFLWSAQILSSIGTSVSQIAYPLLILSITNSPAQAGFISALRSLTYLIFVLPAGVLVDRWSRKHVMLICDFGRFLCIGSIFISILSNQLTITQLYITGFLEVLLTTFFSIAEISCLPQLVRKDQLPSAMAQTQASSGIMHLLGSPLGSILFSLQRAFPFLIDTLSYLTSACALVLIRIPFQEQRTPTQRNLLQEIMEGLSWLWHQPVLRIMAILTAGNVFFGIGQPLVIILIAQHHHTSEALIGFIFSIGGIGGIMGSLLAARIQNRFRFSQVIITTLWLFALLWFALATLPSTWLLSLIVAALFFISPLYNVTNLSYRLTITPDHLQGRVNSVGRLLSNGLAPLGLALTGLLLQYTGPLKTILLLAAGQAILALYATQNKTLKISHHPTHTQ